MILALQAWAWTNLRGRMASEEVEYFGESGRYTLWTSESRIVFLRRWFKAVSLEEWFRLALIPEPPERQPEMLGGASSGRCS